VAVQAARRTPRRSCVACREQRDKRQLIRLVHDAAGVHVDPTMRAAGRGAYLCGQASCWERALRGRGLDHALRTTIDPGDREVLGQFARELDTGAVATAEKDGRP